MSADDDRTVRRRRREQAMSAAARAGGVVSLAAVLLGAPGHLPGSATHTATVTTHQVRTVEVAEAGSDTAES